MLELSGSVITVQIKIVKAIFCGVQNMKTWEKTLTLEKILICAAICRKFSNWDLKNQEYDVQEAGKQLHWPCSCAALLGLGWSQQCKSYLQDGSMKMEAKIMNLKFVPCYYSYHCCSLFYSFYCCYCASNNNNNNNNNNNKNNNNNACTIMWWAEIWMIQF